MPPTRAHLLTYHGVLAPSAAWRDDAVPAAPVGRPRASTPSKDEARPRPRHRYLWAELMRRVFDLDVLRCRACRARRRLVALITSRPVIERILAHLGFQTDPPTISPPRAPPQPELVF